MATPWPSPFRARWREGSVGVSTETRWTLEHERDVLSFGNVRPVMHGFCVAAGGTLCNDRGLLTRLIFDVCMYTRYIYSGKYRRARYPACVCVRVRARARRGAVLGPAIHSEIVSCCADGSRPSRPAAKRRENIAPCSTCIRTPLPRSTGEERGDAVARFSFFRKNRLRETWRRFARGPMRVRTSLGKTCSFRFKTSRIRRSLTFSVTSTSSIFYSRMQRGTRLMFGKLR